MIAFITCSCDGVFILLAVGRAFTNRSWASVYFLQLGWRLLFYYLQLLWGLLPAVGMAFITCSCDGVYILLAVGRAFTNRS